MKNLILAASALAGFAASSASAIEFVNYTTVANGIDLSGDTGAYENTRLGGFGSDLVYDKSSGLYYGLTDRGPGGGTLPYAPRIQAFTLNTDAGTGAIGGFQLQSTIVFKQADGSVFNGQNPVADGRPASDLGRSFDPEGLVLTKQGTFLVSDEYGPSVYEFDITGNLLRKFETPANLIPNTNGTPNYVDGRGVITNGRQDNRGFEGLTVSADGTKAYAILQDPLVNEGNQNDGRRSRNIRVVEFDMETGQPGKQFIYRLENRDDINDRIPGTAEDFSATDQGRSIGVSSITALPDGRFLVIERDNRGYGVDDPNALKTIGSKRIYLVDASSATDVSGVSLAGDNSLQGATAATKTLFLDINAALKAAGVTVGEKIEGFSFGKWLNDGSLQLTIITDNDYSVTQNGSNVQFNVCSDGPGGTSGSVQVAIGEACPTGTSLIPTFLYSFKISGAEANALGLFAPSVPEPASWAMMIAGFGLIGTALRRRPRVGFAG